MSGWLVHNLNVGTRLLLLVAGVCMIISNPLWINAAGLALAVIVILTVLRANQKNTKTEGVC